MSFITIIRAVVIALVITALGAEHALAYFDPNAGGQMFQLLVVTLAEK